MLSNISSAGLLAAQEHRNHQFVERRDEGEKTARSMRRADLRQRHPPNRPQAARPKAHRRVLQCDVERAKRSGQINDDVRNRMNRVTEHDSAPVTDKLERRKSPYTATE